MEIAAKTLISLLGVAKPIFDRSLRLRTTRDRHLSLIGMKDGVQGDVSSKEQVSEALDMTVSAQHLQGLVGLLRTKKDDTTVSVVVEAHAASIQIEGAQFWFPFQDEIPTPVDIAPQGGVITGLAKALKQVTIAASDDPKHGVLCGIRFANNKLTGLDGARVHQAALTGIPSEALVVPLAWAKSVRGFGDGKVDLYESRVGYQIATDDHVIRLVAPVLEGTWPPTGMYFQRQTPLLMLDRAFFMNTVTAILEMEKEFEIQTQLVDGHLGIRTPVGAVLVPSSSYTGDLHGDVVRLDARLIVDALGVIGTEKVKFGLPKPEGEEKGKYVSIEPDDESGFFAAVARRRETHPAAPQ